MQFLRSSIIRNLHLLPIGGHGLRRNCATPGFTKLYEKLATPANYER